MGTRFSSGYEVGQCIVTKRIDITLILETRLVRVPVRGALSLALALALILTFTLNLTLTLTLTHTSKSRGVSCERFCSH